MKTTIYTLSHPVTGEVRYVGKTTKPLTTRISHHLSTAKLRRNYREKWVMSLIEKGLKPVIKYLDAIEGTNEHGSWLEIEWISILGASGRLVNGTEGGEGATGYVHSPEKRAKMSASANRRWADPQERARQGTRSEGKKQSSTTIAKRVAKLQGRVVSPETRAKIAASNRLRMEDPEARAKKSEYAKRQWANPEHRARVSAANTGKSPSAEARAKMSAAQKRRYAAKRNGQ